jgi:hypothetical protein
MLRSDRPGPFPGRVGFGASSFSFSSASGIMRPNIELNMAMEMRPPLFSWPWAPA